ncbi:uncharacterized protein [Dysidea avara]|uniref:uncharacterized protein n=1 Tax=Dysidea avara TaxID=196820 RepID=UPI003329C7F0
MQCNRHLLSMTAYGAHQLELFILDILSAYRDEMIRFIASTVLAGGMGVCAGLAIRRSKKHQEMLQPIIQYTAAAGVVGIVTGASIASRKNTSSLNHALLLGVNFSIGSAVYTGSRAAILHYYDDDQQMKYIASSSSGCVTGAVFAAVSRLGLSTIIVSSVVGTVIGCVGQFGYNKFNSWRQRKAMEWYHSENGNSETSRLDPEVLRRKAVEIIHTKSRYSEAMERRDDLWDQIQHEQSLIATLDEKINELQERRPGSHDPPTIVPPHVITQ